MDAELMYYTRNNTLHCSSGIFSGAGTGLHKVTLVAQGVNPEKYTSKLTLSCLLKLIQVLFYLKKYI